MGRTMNGLETENGEKFYQQALKLERNGLDNRALFHFQRAAEERHLLSTLRLARIYDRGELCVQIDRAVAGAYFKAAAQMSNVDATLQALYKDHTDDAIVFFSLMAQAFLIASESGKYLAHASSAWMWYQVVVSLGRTNLLDDADIFERLKTLLSESQLDEAEERARQFLNSVQ
jgi:TPR repeat protein